MHRRGVLILPLILAARPRLRADAANGDPRKQKLFSMFIAPCCWRENLLVHHSPKADELRAEIVRLIAAGRTDEEIRQTVVGQYSRRVLALPDGATGEWLAWTPAAALLAGFGILTLFLRRSLNARPAAPPAPHEHLPQLPDSEWS
jgi:cytochrome c-type biogenesis protein CcmH